MQFYSLGGGGGEGWSPRGERLESWSGLDFANPEPRIGLLSSLILRMPQNNFFFIFFS
jgi:hypothetical protein